MAGHTYHITEIPDPFAPRHQVAAGGDVVAALSRAVQELLRVVADSKPCDSTAVLRYTFAPNTVHGSQQGRLFISLSVQASNSARQRGLDVVVSRGPLSTFFGFEERHGSDVPWQSFDAVCHVVRREKLLKPLHSPEVNYRIPDSYYLLTPFAAREAFDFATLDRVLDSLNTPVIIEVAVSSVDTASELRAFTAYLDLLQAVNRPRREDWDIDPGPPHKIGSPAQVESFRRPVGSPSPRKDPIADDVSRALRRHSDLLTNRNLFFNIRVAALNAETAELVAAVYAEAAFEDGAFSVIPCDGREEASDTTRGMQQGTVVQVPTLETLCAGNVPEMYRPFKRLSNLATIDEIKGAFFLPVAGVSSPKTIRRDTDPRHVEQDKLLVLGYDNERRFGERGQHGDVAGIPRGIGIDNLVKHVFVAGMPGMGKTSLMLRIICQLWQIGVPMLVLEAVKTEYRALTLLSDSKEPSLRKLAEQIRCYTPGNEKLSPYRHNPFIVPEGAIRDQRLQGVLRCLKAGMALQGPLFPILIESVYRLYDDLDESKLTPTMENLAVVTEKVLCEKGYAKEVESTLLGALRVRFAGLTMGNAGRIFRCTQNVPSIPDLFEYPHIIEFDALEPEQAALETMALLRDIRDHVKDKPFKSGPPRLVIIVEEAHLLVGRTHDLTNRSEHDPDPGAFASDYIVRMLAECRALGISIMICDQLPSAVAAEVVKNTGSTICLRQKDLEEREVMSSAMLLGAMESTELSRFVPGDAFLMTEGYEVPRRIKLENTKHALGLDDPPLGQRLLARIEHKQWFVDALHRRVMDEMESFSSSHNTAKAAVSKLKEKCDRLAEEFKIIEQSPSDGQRFFEELRKIALQTKRLRAIVEKQLKNHERYYGALMDWSVSKRSPKTVIEKRKLVEQEFKKHKKRSDDLLTSIDGIAMECEKLLKK